MLCTRFVIVMLVFALAIPTPLNARPIMSHSMNPNTCSTRLRVDDFILL